MSAIGRNDPCSCGSGKKYKKCCLGKEAAASVAGDFTRAERASAWAAVGRFASRPEFRGDVGAAQAAFFECSNVVARGAAAPPAAPFLCYNRPREALLSRPSRARSHIARHRPRRGTCRRRLLWSSERAL